MLLVAAGGLAACDAPGPATPDLSIADAALACVRLADQPCDANATATACGRCNDVDFLLCVPTAPAASEGVCAYYTPDTAGRDAN